MNESGRGASSYGLWSGTLACAMAITAAGHAELLDDFNDGNDDGWERFSVPDDLQWATWSVYGGVYRLYVDDSVSDAGVPTPEGAIIASILAYTDDPYYSDGYWGATVTRETANTTTMLFMRGDFNPTGAYVFGWRPDARLFIGRVDEFTITVLGVDYTFNQEVGVPYYIEAGAIGSEFELRMWPVGEERPVSPQVTAVDASYPTGSNGVAVQAYASGDLAGSFDDITFAIPCPADVNGDEIVDIDDVFAVLSTWGTCDDCPEDVNDDGAVDVDDLFEILAAWGPCS